MLHITSSQSEAQWSKWSIRGKRAQHKVWGSRPHYPQLQLTLIPFTVCPCFLIWQLWWFLRSGESFQVKFIWTDIPQTKWYHNLGKLCIQRFWFLYGWLIMVVWKTAALARKSSSEASLSSTESLCGTCPHKLKAWHFGNLLTNKLHPSLIRNTKSSNFKSVLKIWISPKEISKSNCTYHSKCPLFHPKKISGYGQKPKYWKIKHSNFTIWWSCSTAALLKTKDSESQLLENSIHRTAGWEQGFWQISHKHITQHVWLNSLLKLGQTQYPLKSTITRRNLGKTQTAWIVMQTEPLLFIQQKGVGKRQGREGKKWGKQ